MKYNFHDFLGLEINTARAAYKKYFSNEYDRIASKKESKSKDKIVVNIVKTLPSEQKGDITRTLTVKNLFSFSYLIRGVHEATTEIYFKEHPVDRIYTKATAVFLQAQILEPIMYYKLLKKGVLFIHAAGVSKNKKAYIFPAQGGTGKTTLSLSLVQSGYRFLGDDLLFVDLKGKTVFPYLRPLHIFSYNINTLRNSNIPFKYRFIVKFKNVLRKVLEFVYRSEFLISTRIHLEEIYHDVPVGSVSKLSKVVFLIKSGDDKKEKVKNSSINSLAKKLVGLFDLNDSLYDNVIVETSSQEKIKALEINAAKKLLDHVPAVYFVNTRKIDIHQPSKVIQLLNE